jgi:FkbM family methyltransferase
MTTSICFFALVAIAFLFLGAEFFQNPSRKPFFTDSINSHYLQESINRKILDPIKLLCPVAIPSDADCFGTDTLAPESILCVPPSLSPYHREIARDYSWASSDFWERDIKETKAWMLDVGANVGTSLLGAASSGHRVLAFEPASINVAYLNSTICANNLQHVVELVQAAVGERSGTVAFFSHPSRGDNSAMTEAGGSLNIGGVLERIVVPLTSIDDYISNHPNWIASECAYVKVDVQGNELRVLEGAQKLLTSAAATNPNFVVRVEQDSRLEKVVLGFSGGVLSLMPTLGFAHTSGEEGGDFLWRPKRQI